MILTIILKCIYHILLYRLREEFGVIKKIKEEHLPVENLQNEQNESIKNNISSNKIKNFHTSKAENVQNKLNCSNTSCTCPRCKNMNGK